MPYMFKLINSGDGAVGKTAFLKRYTEGIFVDESKETIGAGFFYKTIFVGEPKERIDLSIWDLGGQARFRFILNEYIMGAVGALLFFDLTRYGTFVNAESWLELLRQNESNPATNLKRELPILLIGNKSDLADMRAVEYSEGEEFAKENNLLGYIETSAKDNTNVDEAINTIVEYVYKKNKGIF